MHLKLLNRVFVISSLSALFLFSNELSQEILSKDRLELFNLTKEQIKEDSSRLRKDLISPISYSLGKSYDSNQRYDPLFSTISVNQPIFKSGGIYQAIKFANASERFSNLNLEQQKIELIKKAVRLLFEIRKVKFQIKRQELFVTNDELDISRRREEVLNGVSDTSFLNNAIIGASINKNTLADLIFQENNLINEFNSISSGSYDSFELPVFTIISKENFIENNLKLQILQEDIEQKGYLNLLSISKYLPQINFTYNYTIFHGNYNEQLITSNAQNRVGLNLTIPLDIRASNEIQSTRIDYLKSKITLNTTKLEEESSYKTFISQINALDSKKKIAQEDYELYNSLLDDINQAYEAGLNSYTDVQTLQNSKEIRSYDIMILDIDKQLQLLEIYAKQMNS